MLDVEYCVVVHVRRLGPMGGGTSNMLLAGSGVSGAALILHPDPPLFKEKRLLFSLRPDGNLQHVESRLFAHPLKGKAYPGCPLILHEHGPEPRLAFQIEVDTSSADRNGQFRLVHRETGLVVCTEYLCGSGHEDIRLLLQTREDDPEKVALLCFEMPNVFEIARFQHEQAWLASEKLKASQKQVDQVVDGAIEFGAAAGSLFSAWLGTCVPDDPKCPMGHFLVAVDRMPSRYDTRWQCNLCANSIPRDVYGTRGVLHCSVCSYDLCCDCQARDWRCRAGHRLVSQCGKPSYYSSGWICGHCRKNIDSDARGILHCKACTYDLCQSCRKAKEHSKS